MHLRVNQAQDTNEQESGMEEKSNSQVLVLLKYLLSQWLNFAGIPPTEQVGEKLIEIQHEVVLKGWCMIF